MQDLVMQEKFELEVLDKLNSKRILERLVFSGGTMLRLCFGLNRFSVDLDFWVIKKIDYDTLFADIKKCLIDDYSIVDSANKFYTLLFEIKAKRFPRSLKLEIRKETKKIATEQAIAYSVYSNTQVFLNVVTLKDMMSAKVEAFLARKEIRDVFDMEFLIKKGIVIDLPNETRLKLIRGINSLTKNDYTVKLGSLLLSQERKYYAGQNFKLLLGKLE